MNKFWNSSSGTYKIDPESLHIFLSERGYRTYKPSGIKTIILIKVENNRVREVSPDEIWRICWNYIDNEYVREVQNLGIQNPCEYLRKKYNDTCDTQERRKIKQAMKRYNCDGKDRYE